jgi:hypothetical protein
MQPEIGSITATTVEFRDSRSFRWRVYERQKGELYRGILTVLVFESDSTVRIVRSYPANWRDLGATALEDLSWHL